jgi:hypothetical protein
MRHIISAAVLVSFLALASVSLAAPGITPPAGLSIGERIAWWAESFVGTPYDVDPMGLYVTSRRVVADEAVDCMYLTFRSVELALGPDAEGAVEAALNMRFRTRGVLGPDGLVENYDERFEYAMDMIASGKWGALVTNSLGPTVTLPGARSHGPIEVIPREGVADAADGMESGDVIYFIKHPEKRVVGEIVGHLGIALRQDGRTWVIHASGRKNRGGAVVKVPLADYAADMPFAGIMVTRFTAEQ